MRDLLTHFSPLGRTSRRRFQVIILASALVLALAVWAKDIVGSGVCVALIIVTQIAVFIATARRLHDAQRSRWWLALFLFPVSITWDLLTVQVGGFAFHFFDVRTAITLVPIFIGLLAASASIDPSDHRAFQSDQAAA